MTLIRPEAMSKIIFGAIIFAILGVSQSRITRADEPAARVDDLRKVHKQLSEQINELNEKLKDLSSRIRDTEQRQTASLATYIPSSEGRRRKGALKAHEGIHMSGYVDTSYSFNFNRPMKAGTSAGTNQLRVFDSRDNNFDLNALEIDFEKSAPESGGAGFRTDLLYGLNALVTDGAGLNFGGIGGGSADEFDLQQAYGEINIPLNAGSLLGDHINIKAGKFVTMAGAEVIESKDNWNISRSMYFGFGEPAAHTGIRTGFDLWDAKLKTTLGLNNGWDLVQDTGNGKTTEIGLSFNLAENLTFSNVNYIGPESQTDASTGAIIDDMRYLTSSVIVWKTPVQKLTFMAAVDFGNQRNVANLVAGLTAPTPNFDRPFESGQWHSYTFYAKYDLTGKMYFAYRGELFFDDDSFRTFTTTGTAAIPSSARRFWGHTVTLDYRPYTNWIARLEYRQDASSAGVYDRTVGSTEGHSTQGTLATELICVF